MASYSETGYRGLSRQFIAILALATFAWSTFTGGNLVDALFKGAVVYLAMSIIAMFVGRFLIRMTYISIAEAKKRRVEAANSEEGEEAEIRPGANDVSSQESPTPGDSG